MKKCNICGKEYYFATRVYYQDGKRFCRHDNDVKFENPKVGKIPKSDFNRMQNDLLKQENAVKKMLGR